MVPAKWLGDYSLTVTDSQPGNAMLVLIRAHWSLVRARSSLQKKKRSMIANDEVGLLATAEQHEMFSYHQLLLRIYPVHCNAVEPYKNKAKTVIEVEEIARGS